MSKRTLLPSVEWDYLLENFAGQLLAIEVLESAPGIGVTRGALIAADSSEQVVLREIEEFRLENPKGVFAYFDFSPVESDLDVII